MRAAVLLYTEIPNGPALNSVGCDTWYFPVDLAGMSSAFLDERRKYAKVGVMRDPSWKVSSSQFAAMTEAERLQWARDFAGVFSKDFTDLASPSFGASVKQCVGMYDGEYHHSDFHLEFFRAFRKLRNLRAVVWTLEPFQGGWIKPDLRDFVNADPNLVVAVQLYRGNMQPVDASVATKDLEDAGIARQKITTFHGLRDQWGVKRVVPDWWDGALYVENKQQNDTVSY